MSLRAITFDFWNTLYTDSHDGSEDAARTERTQAVRDALTSCGRSPSTDEVTAAWLSGFEAYLAAWQEGRHFGAADQVRHVLGAFEVHSCDGAVETAALRIEEAGALAHLRLLPGVKETIPALAQAGVRLGLISDTGLTPGRILVGFLERDGLLEHFSSLTFSDQTGFPKPDPRMFHQTLAPLGVSPSEAAHVGDTPRTDIAGALGVGMQAVRYAAAVDRGEPPEPDLVVFDHRDLLPLAGL